MGCTVQGLHGVGCEVLALPCRPAVFFSTPVGLSYCPLLARSLIRNERLVWLAHVLGLQGLLQDMALAASPLRFALPWVGSLAFQPSPALWGFLRNFGVLAPCSK